MQTHTQCNCTVMGPNKVQEWFVSIPTWNGKFARISKSEVGSSQWQRRKFRGFLSGCQFWQQTLFPVACLFHLKRDGCMCICCIKLSPDVARSIRSAGLRAAVDGLLLPLPRLKQRKWLRARKDKEIAGEGKERKAVIIVTTTCNHCTKQNKTWKVFQ